MSDIRFDSKLIRRYDLNVPPYTSYPTPPHFHADFNVLSYRRAALLSNAGLPAFEAAIRLPGTGGARAVQYLEYLHREVELQSELFDPRRPVRQIYVTGDPMLLGDATALRQLLQHFDLHFAAADERELCVDIDPLTASACMIRQLAELGFTCANFGMPEINDARPRTAPCDDMLHLVEVARASGFKSVTFDLIYGLPQQTRDDFAQVLAAVMDTKPDRLATYTYPHLPELRAMQRFGRGQRQPSAATRLGLRQLAIETLARAGYVDIGWDRFASPNTPWIEHTSHLPEAECDLLGLGFGTVSRVGPAYAQNAKQLTDYCESLQQHQLPIECGVELTMDDVVRREVIQQIMCQRTLDFSAIGKRYALDFHSYFARELTQLRALADDGLVIDSDTGFAVSERGHLLLPNITTVFDAYRQQVPA